MEEQLQRAAAAALSRQTAGNGISPTTIHVAAAVCLEEVLGRLLTDYAKETSTGRVRIIYGASDELADHVLAGAPVDLFLTAGPAPLARLEEAGLTAPNTRTVLAENTLAAVALAGRRIRVHRSADLASSKVARIALADPSTPLGSYSRDYLRGVGLFDRLGPRVIYVENFRAVSAAVRADHADVGLVYGSDAMEPTGCRLFKVRKRSSPIQMTRAVLRQGRQAEEAKSLLAFLTSRDAAPCFRRCGFLVAADGVRRE
jgi:molybdate transport system substrate-binding protein